MPKKKLIVPKIKKKLNAYLIGEEGKISKKTLLKTGAFAGGISLAIAMSPQVRADHTDNCSTDHMDSISHNNVAHSDSAENFALSPYSSSTGKITSTYHPHANSGHSDHTDHANSPHCDHGDHSDSHCDNFGGKFCW